MNPDLSLDPSIEVKEDKPSLAKLVLLVDTKKTDDSLMAKLSRLRDTVLQSVKDQRMIKAPENSKIVERPFVVDVQNNVFSLISEKDEITSDPYNASVAIIAPQNQFNYSTFKLKLSDTDKELDFFVNSFIHRVKNMDLVENYWMDKSRFSRISRLMLKTVASECWIKHLKFDPLVDPFFLDVKRDEKMSKSTYKALRKDHLKLPIKRNEALLREAIRENLTHNLAKEHANALVHMLRVVCQKQDMQFFIQRHISVNESLVPTVEMLRRLGKIPDLRIKEYKNLFHPREWTEVGNSPLFITEQRIKELLKTKLTAGNVASFLSEVSEIEKKVRQDTLSNVILDVKHQRLGKAAVWKKKSDRPGDPLQVMNYARRRIRDEGVLDTFSPNRVLVSSGKYGGISELRSCLTYDTQSRSWTVGPSYQYVPESQKVVLDEFILWLNSP
jgi:hypothetical protein